MFNYHLCKTSEKWSLQYPIAESRSFLWNWALRCFFCLFVSVLAFVSL